MNTTLVEEKELISRLRQACNDIETISSCESVLSVGGVHRDPVQTLVMRRGANGDHLITPVIESAAIQAEIRAAGAGESFLRILPTSLREDVERRSLGVESDEEWEKILEKIKTSSIPCRKKDIDRIFSIGGKSYKRIITSIFDLICADDSISIKKSPIAKTQISRDSGFVFEGLSIDNRFFSRGTWDRKRTKVVLIDGIIENVSEIHHLLEDLSSHKQPCIIFCIDSLPDVTETLVKNFYMRNLDTILVKVPVEHDHVNTLADLGVIFGAHPVAASLGDSISSGIKNQNCFADRVTISRGRISLECLLNKKAVDSHVRSLRDRIRDDINLSQVLEPRINRLSSSTTRVSVGIEDLKVDPTLVEKLDRTFRTLQRALKTGFIEKNDFQEFSSEKIDLLFGVNHAISAEMASQAIKTLLSTRAAIRSAKIGIRQF